MELLHAEEKTIDNNTVWIATVDYKGKDIDLYFDYEKMLEFVREYRWTEYSFNGNEFTRDSEDCIIDDWFEIIQHAIKHDGERILMNQRPDLSLDQPIFTPLKQNWINRLHFTTLKTLKG